MKNSRTTSSGAIGATMANPAVSAMEQSAALAFQNWLLRVAVLTGGAAVMVVEILGSRILAPTFGTTLHVWTALITVTLAALATGYALGGRLADQRPRFATLAAVFAIAAGALLLSQAMTRPVLAMTYGMGLVGGTFMSAILLFFPALFLMGMISPLVVRLSADQQHLGRSVGNLYALSTVGSVAGSLAVSLLLIPHFSVHVIIAITAAALGLIPLVWYFTARKTVPGVLLALALALGATLTVIAGEEANQEITYRGTTYRVLEREHSSYGDLAICETGSTRLMFLNGINQGSIAGNFAAANYAWSLTRVVTAGGMPKNVLIWGLGPGLIARMLSEAGARVTAIEIDPACVNMARKHFGLPGKVNVITGDARTETTRLTDKYDAIILDAFGGDSPPFHLLTREAFEGLKSHLTPGGVLVCNVVGGIQGLAARAPASVIATMEGVFGKSVVFAPNAESFKANPQDYVSTLLLATGNVPEQPVAYPLNMPPERRAFVDQVFGTKVTLPRENAVVLTDAYAPIDAWSDAAVKAFRY
ncbi:MAG: spermidine synthase [Blastocatellia bacterium]